MTTPIKFMLSNEETPLTTDIDEYIKNVVVHMLNKALADRDGTLTFNITPFKIHCEYQPAPPEQPETK